MPVLRKTWLTCLCGQSRPSSSPTILSTVSTTNVTKRQEPDRIPFTLTFYPHNHAVKIVILNNFKLLQNDPETGRIFSQPPLISFKRDKNVGSSLVKAQEYGQHFSCNLSRKNVALQVEMVCCAYYHLLAQQIFVLQKVDVAFPGSFYFLQHENLLLKKVVIRATNHVNLQRNIVAR